MKTKYLAVLIAAMGSSLSLGASISNLKSAYFFPSRVHSCSVQGWTFSSLFFKYPFHFSLTL